LADQAGGDVGRAGRRDWHDQAHGARGIGLRAPMQYVGLSWAPLGSRLGPGRHAGSSVWNRWAEPAAPPSNSLHAARAKFSGIGKQSAKAPPMTLSLGMLPQDLGGEAVAHIASHCSFARCLSGFGRVLLSVLLSSLWSWLFG
jgi:hypothetical protein